MQATNKTEENMATSQAIISAVYDHQVSQLATPQTTAGIDLRNLMATYNTVSLFMAASFPEDPEIGEQEAGAIMIDVINSKAGRR